MTSTPEQELIAITGLHGVIRSVPSACDQSVRQYRLAPLVRRQQRHEARDGVQVAQCRWLAECFLERRRLEALAARSAAQPVDPKADDGEPIGGAREHTHAP